VVDDAARRCRHHAIVVAEQWRRDVEERLLHDRGAVPRAQRAPQHAQFAEDAVDGGIDILCRCAQGQDFDRMPRGDRDQYGLGCELMEGRAPIQHFLAELAVASGMHLEQQPVPQPGHAKRRREVIERRRADNGDPLPRKAFEFDRAGLAERAVKLDRLEEIESVAGEGCQGPNRRLKRTAGGR
jgi:hypothetical protein